MKSTDFSPQFSEVWGENAASETITYPIPTTTTASGRASLDAGFTSVNMTVLAAGGIPPFGQDFNGILKMLSTSSQNYESGNVPTWSSNFATSIGGYPEYSLVLYNGNYYVSTADSNTTTPGAYGASWKSLFDGYARLNQPANFQSLSTTDTLDLSDYGNNIPSTYWVKAQDYATKTWVNGTYVPGVNGYEIKPNGKIEQWGSYTTTSTGLLSITFPVTFPNSCDNIVVCEANASGQWTSNTPTLHGVYTDPNASGFSVVVRTWSAVNSTWGPGSASGYFRAVGH